MIFESNTISLTKVSDGADGQVQYIHIMYSDNPNPQTSSDMTTTPSDYMGICVSTDVTPPTDPSLYKWQKVVGNTGEDGYTVILTNENESFPCDGEGNIVEAINTSTQAIVFKGNETVSATIGTLPSVAGMTLSSVQNMVSIVVNKGATLADSGNFSIPIIADGHTFTKVFSWTKVFDMSGELNDVITTITQVESTVDKIEGEMVDKISQTTFDEYKNTVSSQFSSVTQTIGSITSEVSSLETDFNNQLQAQSTKIEQTSELLSLIASGDSESSLTLTDNFISLVSEGTVGILAEEFNIDALTTFMNTAKNGSTTIIDGGALINNSITTEKLVTDILKSSNYQEPDDDVWSLAGSFFDLTDGSFTSKNFVITDDGNVYIRGTVYATSGSFSGTVYATDGEFKGSIKAGSTITGATITGSTINTTSGKFTVDNDGILHATDAIIQGTITATNSSFSGTVTATAGSIGGFSIQNGTLQGGSVTLNPNSISCGDNFSVNSEGILNATNGYFSGVINAESGSFTGTIDATGGTIGGFTITNDSLYNGSDSLGGSGVYVSPNGISCNDLFVVDESNNTGKLAGFVFTNQLNNSEHAYANTLYRIVNGSDGYDYQAGIKAASATNGETEAAFYVRKKLRSQNWGQSTLPFYVRNNGYVYAEDLTVGNSLYMMGSVLVDDDEYNYVNTRFKVLSGSANSVDVGMLNNSSGGWFSSYGDSGSTYDIYYSLSGTSGALYCPYTFEYNNIDSSDGKARFSFRPSSTNVKSNIGSPNMYFQNGYLTTLYVNTINLNGDPITEWPKGGGGTTNYVDLTNKPKIENNTLNAGNNTAASLGLATAGHNHAGQTLGSSSNPVSMIYATQIGTINPGVQEMYVKNLHVGSAGNIEVSGSITLGGVTRKTWPSGGGITNATASASSVSSSSQASVTVDVSGSTASFTFKIPKGKDGRDGVNGRDGIDGQDGRDGVDSDQIRASNGYGIIATTSKNIYPALNGSRYNNAVSLGGSNYYYYKIFYTNLEQASDRDVKNTITKISDNKNIENFYMQLNPVSYYLNDDEEHNKRFGFIAQDVENNLIQNNIYSDKYALITSYLQDDNDEGSSKSKYSICYTEFISLNTHMTQKAHKRIDQLESENQQLTNQILTLQGELLILKQQMQEIKEAIKHA